MPKKKKQPKQKNNVNPTTNPTQPTQVQLYANNQFCSILHTTFFDNSMSRTYKSLFSRIMDVRINNR